HGILGYRHSASLGFHLRKEDPFGTHSAGARVRMSGSTTHRSSMLIRRRNRDPGAPAACAMAVMGKASAPGRTKTRLVPPLSGAEAAELNTAFLRDIIGNLLSAGHEAEIAPYVAFGPAGSEPFFRA